MVCTNHCQNTLGLLFFRFLNNGSKSNPLSIFDIPQSNTQMADWIKKTKSYLKYKYTSKKNNYFKRNFNK